MATRRKPTDRRAISVELYRGSYNQDRSLERYLKDYEAVERVSRVARKTSGAIEVGYLLYVHVLPVIEAYVGTKLLTIIEDRVKEWFKEHGTREQFITLGLSGQKRRRKVGKGRPKRYY
jgi:hypothetical protein